MPGLQVLPGMHQQLCEAIGPCTFAQCCRQAMLLVVPLTSGATQNGLPAAKPPRSHSTGRASATCLCTAQLTRIRQAQRAHLAQRHVLFEPQRSDADPATPERIVV
jgi:hypothetical protein